MWVCFNIKGDDKDCFLKRKSSSYRSLLMELRKEKQASHKSQTVEAQCSERSDVAASSRIKIPLHMIHKAWTFKSKLYIN